MNWQEWYVLAEILFATLWGLYTITVRLGRQFTPASGSLWALSDAICAALMFSTPSWQHLTVGGYYSFTVLWNLNKGFKREYITVHNNLRDVPPRWIPFTWVFVTSFAWLWTAGLAALVITG